MFSMICKDFFMNLFMFFIFMYFILYFFHKPFSFFLVTSQIILVFPRITPYFFVIFLYLSFLAKNPFKYNSPPFLSLFYLF